MFILLLVCLSAHNLTNSSAHGARCRTAAALALSFGQAPCVRTRSAVISPRTREVHLTCLYQFTMWLFARFNCSFILPPPSTFLTTQKYHIISICLLRFGQSLKQSIVLIHFVWYFVVWDRFRFWVFVFCSFQMDWSASFIACVVKS